MQTSLERLSHILRHNEIKDLFKGWAWRSQEVQFDQSLIVNDQLKYITAVKSIKRWKRTELTFRSWFAGRVRNFGSSTGAEIVREAVPQIKNRSAEIWNQTAALTAARSITSKPIAPNRNQSELCRRHAISATKHTICVSVRNGKPFRRLAEICRHQNLALWRPAEQEEIVEIQ